MDKNSAKNSQEETINQEKESNQTQSENIVGTQEATSPEEESFKDKFLRLNADFQNHKRRIDKERLEWMTEAQIMILDKFLPIFDELDRAIELSSGQEDNGKEEWLKGFQLIQKNWKKLFKDLNIKEITDREGFNPELHDALMQVDDETKKTGDIVQLLSKGYTYKDKVVKHAKVSVAK